MAESRRLDELMQDGDPERVRRVAAAMLKMVKLDITARERALDA